MKISLLLALSFSATKSTFSMCSNNLSVWSCHKKLSRRHQKFESTTNTTVKHRCGRLIKTKSKFLFWIPIKLKQKQPLNLITSTTNEILKSPESSSSEVLLWLPTESFRVFKDDKFSFDMMKDDLRRRDIFHNEKSQWF